MSLINIEKTVTLDVYDHDTTPSAIKAIQMDAGTRNVFAVIRNSGQTYDIGQNASVSLIVLRPDKTKVQITGEPYPITETTMDGDTITYYGVSAELTQLALAVKGNLKAQFKITSGEQELRTEIFTINNGEALDAGDGDWAGDLDGHNLDEMAQDIEDTKAAVTEMETDVSELKSGFTDLEGSVVKTVNGNTPDENGNVEVEGGVDESIIEYGILNMAKNTTFSAGYLNNTNGNVQSSTDYQTSDFIPVEDGAIYVLKNVKRYCAYNENKEYPSAVYGTDTTILKISGRSYIRISVLNANIDDVFVCNGEQYYPDEIGFDKQPQNINAVGDNFVPKMLGEIASTDNAHFATGTNLFDINGGYLYVLGQAQVAINGDTGANNVNVNQFRQNLDRKYSGEVIPNNGCIASTYFIPVQAGKYMFANYSYWVSAAYDSDKNYALRVPACQRAFTGYLIPEGVAFVRINFKAQSSEADGYLHSAEEAKNIMVWQEDEAVCTRPATTLQNQIDGSFVSPTYLDKVVPNMIDSDFLSAMKCMTVREINRREHAWRFGNFNAYVGSGTNGYYLIRKMLMDNGVDFCGFEEMGGRATDIGAYLKSWQFADGFVSPKNDSGKGTNALSIVSRFEVQTWNTYTMTTVTSNKDCINARIRLPRYMDVYNPFRILSMYVIHPMVGANQQNLADELLTIIANDDSDYIVITSDTNSFGDTEESKVFWRVLEAGGFRPTIPITTKTVTQDNLSSESDAYPEKPWRHHSIDQIFISSNIDCVSYNVINTKDEYIGFYKNNTTTDGEYALSDHDFVYADLVFKNEARQ